MTFNELTRYQESLQSDLDDLISNQNGSISYSWYMAQYKELENKIYEIDQIFKLKGWDE